MWNQVAFRKNHLETMTIYSLKKTISTSTTSTTSTLGATRRLLSAGPSLSLHGIYDRPPTAFAHHNIRPGTAPPHSSFKHHLIRRRCFPSWQCLPMCHTENMGVFAPWISALECEFQWINTVPIVVFAIRTPPAVASRYLGVEHIAESLRQGIN